jgi:hypothetical protein
MMDADPCIGPSVQTNTYLHFSYSLANGYDVFLFLIFCNIARHRPENRGSHCVAESRCPACRVRVVWTGFVGRTGFFLDAANDAVGAARKATSATDAVAGAPRMMSRCRRLVPRMRCGR